MQKVKTAIIPAAGFGTRMLPATKAIPKEMLPVGNKPAIQYIVEELSEAGIEHIIIVTGYHKRAIEDHFDNSFELREWLKKTGKLDELKEIDRITSLAKFTFIRQSDGYGNAIPVLSAQHLLEDEPFMLLWGDIISDKRRTKRAIETYEEYGASVLCATPKMDKDDYSKYGYISGKNVAKNIYKVSNIIEKPGAQGEHLGLAVMNGYLLTPDIFKYTQELRPNSKGELCIIDAIAKMSQEEVVYAVDIQDIEQYDIGNAHEYLITNISIGQKTGLI